MTRKWDCRDAGAAYFMHSSACTLVIFVSIERWGAVVQHFSAPNPIRTRRGERCVTLQALDFPAAAEALHIEARPDLSFSPTR